MNNLIPNQVEGKKVDLSHSEIFTSKNDAAECFHRACEHLLNPNEWHKLAGIFSAEFYNTKQQLVKWHKKSHTSMAFSCFL